MPKDMKFSALFGSTLTVAVCLALPAQVFAQGKKKSPVSVDAYYYGLSTDPNALQPEQIDYSAVSMITFFGIMLNEDATLNWNHSQAACPDVASRTVSLAHAAGKKVIISVGAEGDPGVWKNSRFELAVSDEHRTLFIESLLRVVKDCDFDGIDLDWEPLLDEDAPVYTAFSHELRTALNEMAFRSRYRMLTAAVATVPQLFSQIQGDFDQIDLMTYDLAGEHEGDPLWHNSALMSGPDSQPSADSMLKDFLDAGVAPEKLEIGIDFYGYVWTSVTQSQDLPYPGQVWKGQASIQENVPYSAIMDRYYRDDLAHWDDDAKSPYLSAITPEGFPQWVTYDDARACQEKVRYARDKGLAGVFIWELGGEWRPTSEKPQALSAAIRAAARR